ncbi:3'-5' exoribonuclease YhaM family protein [Fructilactobacillus fructivorans]|uniref:3'->5' exoribonuclease Bsu YhaM n=1 Tax=Fructilactobacillus fructivorans TaxID=1614 RepID=A0A0C1PQB7_9LACO|nr:HD domain-containing protein [Fructilactobacillus fructivorans]KID42086.1 3'->5' exoribonuclease Bsu YhaM [Fructilactobacillus fructivorans]MCT0151978.1 HD domain-containing protein [Fructilactobacillus fructivorans]MCT2867870.1 HD domain-containing protein [Fructilactobacillus fructivorans]MCT2868548.1 HD domain-containing protein [Fructilactobacillus fructivorans]MCT2873548.1 HD domain-containing protein [Fructilactobacillus fructivorans]
MSKKLKEYQLDEDIDAFVLIKSADARIAKNGKQFISFVFEDNSGEIGGKLWGASNDDVKVFKSGQVVHINGKREAYQGSPQIKINHIRQTETGEPNDPSSFMQHAQMTRFEMEEYISQTIFEIINPTWNRVVRTLLKKHQDEFFTYPAAKTNHHAYAGGLAFHTISILKLAKGVAKLYPQVNPSLLYAGAILHDLGKTTELSGPVATSYTSEGDLLGHISIIDGEIVEAADQLKINQHSEDLLLLRHMVLSHHGIKEYGSPVTPELLEAQILHDLDDLDASINMITGALSDTEFGSFSKRIFGMDRNKFYKPESKEKGE